jgi:hypothetical protein
VVTSLDMKPASEKCNDTGTKGKKRDNTNYNIRTSNEQKSSSSSSAAEARSTVQSAISHNPVLLNLFGSGKDDKKQHATEKEKRDALFTRNC